MSRKISILGAGLVGSLLAVILRKRGYEVTIYERRPDLRTAKIGVGRSINLATSARGWKALELAGLKQEFESIAIPMYGRYLHQMDGSHITQAYSKNNEAIYSVSRGELNKRLMSIAENEGATIHFEHRCSKVDLQKNELTFHLPDGTEQKVVADLLLGADGAFSALRDSYAHSDRVNTTQNYLEYGYKELNIPPDANGNMRMERNYLHIWPRGKFMLIALPNMDGSFTCTLFLPFEGDVSFANLHTEDQVKAFFGHYFKDAMEMMPTLMEDFFANPTSSLVTTTVFPWHFGDRNALIGDAAHAIVPFYGQGMNAGFEDCSVLSRLMDKHGNDWTTILNEYEIMRKPNGDAVGKLALLNFVEMRDKVADSKFLERKKIEKDLGLKFPDKFISIYEMVSFSHIPYDTTIRCIEAQDSLLQNIMNEGDYFTNIHNPEFEKKLNNWVAGYHETVQLFDFGNEA